MKDLFVELAQLTGSMGAAAALAVDLRAEMLAASEHEAALEQRLADELTKLSADARGLAADIRAKQVGVNFTDAELDGPPPTAKRPTQKKRKSPVEKL